MILLFIIFMNLFNIQNNEISNNRLIQIKKHSKRKYWLEYSRCRQKDKKIMNKNVDSCNKGVMLIQEKYNQINSSKAPYKKEHEYIQYLSDNIKIQNKKKDQTIINNSSNSVVKIIRFKCVDFWKGFSHSHLRVLYSLISEKYKFIKTKDNPDYVFYSVFGKKHLEYIKKENPPILIEYIGENENPNWSIADYSIDMRLYFDKGDRHFYLPHFFLYSYNHKKNILFKERTYKSGKKFCAAVISNYKALFRNKFLKELSKYKKVDSAGRYNNNIGKCVIHKIEFLQDYKFTLAFENSEHPGYLTEKIIDAFNAHTIPIYWGDPKVDIIFNTKAFIWVKNENDISRAIHQIIEIDNNEILYKKMLKEQVFNDNDYIENEMIKLKHFLMDIFDNEKECARRRGKNKQSLFI